MITCSILDSCQSSTLWQTLWQTRHNLLHLPESVHCVVLCHRSVLPNLLIMIVSLFLHNIIII